MNILHITSILPAPLNNKRDENDILIRIAQEYQKKYPADNHYFLLVVPYANLFIGNFKEKWKEYAHLIKLGEYEYEEFKINVIGLPVFKRDRRFRTILTKIGYQLNKDKIKCIIDKIKPDIIHAHNLRGNSELAQIIKNEYSINYISTLRGEDELMINKINSARLTPSKLLSVNQHKKNRYSKSIDLPIKVIPHPIDEDGFINKSDISLPNNILRIVSIGRLLGWKNYDKVIIALSKLTIEFYYDIYGDGPELLNLKSLTEELGLQEKVTFFGRVPHCTIKKNLPKYSVLIQISYPETLGRVYFEAMAARVPVIASKNTGIDGLIIDGEEGFIVDHSNENELLTAIQTFQSFSIEEKILMKEKARKRALKYRWSNTLEEYHLLYHDIN